MPNGIVKWFNNAKGFGFIVEDGGSDDIFAHFSSIEMDGFRTLKAGQAVSFDIEKGDKGLHAAHIKGMPPTSETIKVSAPIAAPPAKAQAFEEEHA
ncbi:MAG: cold shock domain-containing protein CspD [Marinagarivorans sp.]|nr:cold shock domain-containing protein CspD [Marinagarivorans sp.]